MADKFRQQQRKDCLDGSPNKKSQYGSRFTKIGKHIGNYGCVCCRKFADLGKFKKWSRKKARRMLKNLDRNTLND